MYSGMRSPGVLCARGGYGSLGEKIPMRPMPRKVGEMLDADYD